MICLKTYWYPLLEGKSVGEITRDDIYQIFTHESVSKLAPKTINSIVSAITIPMKWAYFHGLTNNNCYDGILKCSAKSKKREVLTLEQGWRFSVPNGKMTLHVLQTCLLSIPE